LDKTTESEGGVEKRPEDSPTSPPGFGKRTPGKSRKQDVNEEAKFNYF
jgi:hypothetical protein